MDPRVFEQAARFQAFATRGVTFVRRSKSPLEAVLLGLASVVLLAVFLVLLIPFVFLAGALALGAAAYSSLRRMLARAEQPNGRIGPLRTDGRDNVRVIRRDEP